jgi:hypothetical protein
MDFTRRFLFFDRKLGKIAARYQQVQGAKATFLGKREKVGSRT